MYGLFQGRAGIYTGSLLIYFSSGIMCNFLLQPPDSMNPISFVGIYFITIVGLYLLNKGSISIVLRKCYQTGFWGLPAIAGGLLSCFTAGIVFALLSTIPDPNVIQIPIDDNFIGSPIILGLVFYAMVLKLQFDAFATGTALIRTKAFPYLYAPAIKRIYQLRVLKSYYDKDAKPLEERKDIRMAFLSPDNHYEVKKNNRLWLNLILFALCCVGILSNNGWQVSAEVKKFGLILLIVISSITLFAIVRWYVIKYNKEGLLFQTISGTQYCAWSEVEEIHFESIAKKVRIVLFTKFGSFIQLSPLHSKDYKKLCEFCIIESKIPKQNYLMDPLTYQELAEIETLTQWLGKYASFKDKEEAILSKEEQQFLESADNDAGLRISWRATHLMTFFTILFLPVVGYITAVQFLG